VSFRPPPIARLAALAGALAVAACADRIPPPPAQPIRFSHRIHAGINRIGCLVCHSYAERGPVAGIPSMARCQGCHKFVRQDPENPAITAEIKALEDRLDEEKPVEWIRVHRLPDHVFFTHQRHVHNGVACSECHGEVERMETDRQVAPLTMGWCLECHRRKQAEAPLERAHLTDCVTCHK
jgi:hypothetical protein